MSNEINDDKARAMGAALMAASVAYDNGYQKGVSDGMEAGIALGIVIGAQSLQAAVSDGLRHGSPECGRALRSMKRLGINKE